MNSTVKKDTRKSSYPNLVGPFPPPPPFGRNQQGFTLCTTTTLKVFLKDDGGPRLSP